MVKSILIPNPLNIKEITSKTWGDVKTLDDCILKGDRVVIDDLKKKINPKTACPCLKTEGSYFYFCAKYLNELDLKDNEIGPANKKYQSHIGVAEMQLFCMDNYKNCNFYKGELKR